MQFRRDQDAGLFWKFKFKTLSKARAVSVKASVRIAKQFGHFARAEFLLLFTMRIAGDSKA